MALESWLPVGFTLPDGAKVRVALFEGTDWQIYETAGGGRALVAQDTLAQRWLDSGLILPTGAGFSTKDSGDTPGIPIILATLPYGGVSDYFALQPAVIFPHSVQCL